MSTTIDRGRLARLVDERVDDLPQAARWVEEQRAEEIDHRDGRTVPGLDDRQPATRCGGWKFAGLTTVFAEAR